jgi:hypothetical protein
MSTATERLVGGDPVVSVPAMEASAEPVISPEWHSLRLFGRGRHFGAFLAGAELHDEL